MSGVSSGSSHLDDYDRRVAQGLALPLDEVERLAKMTQEERVQATRWDGAEQVRPGR